VSYKFRNIKKVLRHPIVLFVHRTKTRPQEPHYTVGIALPGKPKELHPF